MSRRRAAVKRDINPDAKFSDIVVAKFMNCMMVDGKKSVSETIFYATLKYYIFQNKFLLLNFLIHHS